VERHAIQAEYNAAQKELAAPRLSAPELSRLCPKIWWTIRAHRETPRRIALAEVRGEGCGQCGVHIRPHVIQQLERPEMRNFSIARRAPASSITPPTMRAGSCFRRRCHARK